MNVYGSIGRDGDAADQILLHDQLQVSLNPHNRLLDSRCIFGHSYIKTAIGAYVDTQPVAYRTKVSPGAVV